MSAMTRPSILISFILLASTSCFVQIVEPDDEVGESGETAESGETGDAQVDCGDGEREEGEQCDGQDLNEQTCVSLGYVDGALACLPDCSFDLSDCTPVTQCGDGVVGEDEECDGEDLAGRTCESFGFGGGELACTDTCEIDTSGCTA